MSEPLGTLIARLNEDDIDDLERRLAIAMSKLTPGTSRRVRGPEKEMVLETPGQHELKEVTSEIIENARLGVRIAPQTESRPLIPLFKAAKVELPPEIKIDHEQMRYEFYSVEVIFSILLPKDQFPLSAELELYLTDDAQVTARRTRPIRLFPSRKDLQLFEADLEGAVGIDASLNMSSPTLQGTPLPFPLSGDVTANAKLKAGFVIGPLRFPFRKAAVEVRGESDQSLFWRYTLRSELSERNEFKSVLILKVAEEVSSVQIAASLGVVPSKRSWLLFRNILPQLTSKVTLPVETVPRRT
jgi:hypothetical protein